MLQFGNLEVVKKTFTREEVEPRGQAYNGIKFRRYESESKANPGLKEQFIVSNKAFEELGLKQYALTQANFDGQVYLLVVEDQDEVEPAARILRQSIKKDGTPMKKGKMFSNEFITSGLVENGTLDGTTHENQYLALEKQEIGEDFPKVVKAAYRLIKDETVDASADTENNTEEEAAETDNRNF
jgi:hypothetical protein